MSSGESCCDYICRPRKLLQIVVVAVAKMDTAARVCAPWLSGLWCEHGANGLAYDVVSDQAQAVCGDATKKAGKHEKRSVDPAKLPDVFTECPCERESACILRHWADI